MRILIIICACLFQGCSSGPDLRVAATAAGAKITAEGTYAVPVVITVTNDGASAARDFTVAVTNESGAQLALAVPGQETAWYPVISNLAPRSRTVVVGEVHMAERGLTRRLLVHVDRCRPGEQQPCAVRESDESNNVAQLRI